MESVWVVEKGEGTDYYVVGIFSTEENAEKVSVLVADSSVSKWPIDAGIEYINQGRHPYRVTMGRDGTIKNIHKADWHFSFVVDGPILIRPTIYPEGVLLGTVFATDEEHTVKIMDGVRVQHIASGAWPE